MYKQQRKLETTRKTALKPWTSWINPNMILLNAMLTKEWTPYQEKKIHTSFSFCFYTCKQNQFEPKFVDVLVYAKLQTSGLKIVSKNSFFYIL